MYIDLVISWDLTMKNGGLMGFNQQKWWFLDGIYSGNLLHDYWKWP
jgi:hypothetical protein